LFAVNKLDGTTMFLNEDHVERVEGGANSAIHLVNGTYFVVRDDVDTINARIRAEKESLLAGALAVSGRSPLDDEPVRGRLR
jgi:uncharacterized protein YlzI (FlbEa/FlbD family)